jgi:hypothetical protein
MKIKDQQKWDECVRVNKDPYGEAIVKYAAKWGDLMEIEISNGKVLEEIAKDTSHTADEEGITGFMYGCAVQILAECWSHGDDLRRWHNASYGVSNTSGTVNPAIMTIDTEPKSFFSA